MFQKLSLNPLGLVPQIIHYDTLGRHMRYVEIGNDNKPLVFFIHGAPSSSSFWMRFLKDSSLLAQAKLLAVDRPGYGYSDYGVVEKSVKKQAEVISYILKKKRSLHNKIILHGSSYGGTVAARIAMDFPHLVDGLILQSASTAPGEEKIYWITKPTTTFPIDKIIPWALRMANEEKLSHRTALENMEAHWDKIDDPVIILHGTDDQLIYPSNATYSKEKLINAPFVDLIWAEGKGHDLVWTKRDIIFQALNTMITGNW